ncbi:MAG TPA: bifunctional 4-hydroxy-3-methylbut-2-enyl diphosphate reductase/30S ribosomal protein S1 [Lachnospiraceae bacterium]|nr:bifunctional 4-hydroxy-3-methylbut-2-enyl diphosphate reductase/30S ribosomal protein S1 [Lachnospiraceae bacterium]
MEIILAKSAGFCFGVKKAVEYAYGAVGRKNVFTYGPIIHNKTVTDELEKKGIRAVEDFNVPSESEIIIRSHGVPPTVYRELEKRGIAYEDKTCPFVKKIHDIVKRKYNDEGKSIIIVGNSSHPEIVGINGECDNTAVIIDSVEDEKLKEIDCGKSYALVVQTTFRASSFEEISDKINKICPNVEVFNTICSATSNRQKEAEEISSRVDIMIVLGDKGSSNTKKLYEICTKNCKNTFLCETIYDLLLQNKEKNVKIGITAGASTPPEIIKEAVSVMSELENNKTFEEMVDDSLVSVHSGDIVKGTVIAVNEVGEVSVNLKYKSDGIITKENFSDDPDCNPADVVKPGDEIDVYVVRVNDGDGNVILSKKKAEADKNYVVIEEAYNNGETVHGKVTSTTKGGLLASVNEVSVFIPSSQISNRYVEDLSQFVGNEYDFEVLECDRSKRRFVVGRKALVQKEIEEKKKEVFSKLSIGDRVKGTVSRIVDFGAFVDLGGVDGLIHISELSWGRVKKVSDVLSVGDEVEVTVLDLNEEKGKISLSLKDEANNPWNNAADKYAVGNIVKGKVVRMVSFGAFVELEDGIDGLVHISQIANRHVEKPEDELSIGQEIMAKVTELDLDNKKVSLSIKNTLEKSEDDQVDPDDEAVEAAQEINEEENTEE